MKKYTWKRTVVMAMVLALLVSLSIPAFAASEPTYVSSYASKQEAIEAGAALNLEIAEEGMILLKNEGNALPLTGSNITVFGYASVAPAGGGSAGGDTSAGIVKLQADIYSSLADAGFTVNPDVKASYDAWLANEAVSSDAMIAGADLAAEQEKWAGSFAGYGDAAVVVLSNGSGIVSSMTGTAITSLAYDAEQYALIDYAAEHFEKVIVLINSSSPREILPLKNNDKVDAILVIGEPGDNGFEALGRILNGQVNPSARTADTWAADYTKDPATINFNTTGDAINGYGRYTVNGEQTNSYYVQYEEGIYVGYRYYETRGFEDGEDWYNANVAYPFGYGLSYTTFDWEVTPLTAAESTIQSKDTLEFDVKVTNTGSAAGKDVVELYYTAPYGDATSNPTKIEKSQVVLGDFAKTDLLQPGESQTLRLSLDVFDMASYDYAADKTYVLDDGTYTIRISANAHEAKETVNYVVKEKELCSTSVTGYNVTNVFDDVTEGYLANTDSRLSRADFAGTMPTAAPAAIELTEEQFSAWSYTYGDKESDPWYSSEMPAQADAETRPEKAAVVLADLVGKDYNDPQWDTLLDELTIDELAALINNGGFHSVNIDYIEKPYSHDTDGPKGWTGSGTDSADAFNKFAAEPVIASTFNKDLLYRMGEMIGEQGLWGNSTQADGTAYSYTGWYAPGMNIHRSPFDSRYTEYYSEDPVLTGMLASQVSLGAKSKGCYVSLKHFAFHNDGGGVGLQITAAGYSIAGYRGGAEASSGLSTWFDEQTAREVYLKGYQIAVEEGKASFVMESFNRLGSTWAGGSYALNTEILRNEWGFQGAVVTDIAIYNFLPADQMIRAGVDMLLNSGSRGAVGTSEGFTEYDATQVTAMRNAAKHILYMVANSNAMQIPKGAKVRYTWPTVTDEDGETTEIVVDAAKQGQAYETPVLTTAALNTYGAYSEIAYSVAGLPAGLELTADGKFAGTPMEAGTFYATITAHAEGYAPASVTYTIEVEADPNAPAAQEPTTPTAPTETDTDAASCSHTGYIAAIVILAVCLAVAVVLLFLKTKKKKN